MTIDEAIAHAREVVEKKYTEGMLCHANPDDGLLDGCIECAKEHEQLAEWLEELKEARKGFEENRKAGYKHGYSDGYNKAIDEFANTLIPRLTDAIYKKDVESMTNLINDVARELKAGGENERFD